MIKHYVFRLALTILVLCLVIQGWAIERGEIPEKYHWKTDDLYSSLDQWEAAFDSVRVRISRLEEFKGRLGDKVGSNLADFIALSEPVDAEVSRVVYYAYYNFQVDMRDAAWTGRRDQAFALGSEYGQRTAWYQPELLTIPEDTLIAWTGKYKVLAPYKQSFQDLFALKEHSLSEPEETLLSLAGDLAGESNNIYTNLMSVDMDFPTVVDEQGDSISATAVGWREVYRSDPDRTMREKYFKAAFGRHLQFSNTCAATIASQYKTDAFYARARHFENSLEAYFSPNFIPTAIFHNLIRTAHDNTAPLQKYLAIRKRALGIDHYKVWDEYVLLGALEEDSRYTWEQAVKKVVDAVEPLGKAYTDETEFILDPANRYVDPFTNDGKISGAWSHNSLCEPSRMIFNFDYENGLTAGSISTIAHEAGHALHTNNTMRSQPYVLRGKPTLLDEVPSITIETLYHLSDLDAARKDYRQAKGDAKEVARQRLVFLLDQLLSKGASAFYKQVLYAEWEWEAHLMVERGEPITNESLTQLYAKLLNDYYGSSLESDDLTNHFWASVPHLYLGFYTYSYAVGEVCAAVLATDMLAESRGDNSKRGAVDRYINFLKAGSSKHPDQLLKDAGVDLTTAKPIESFVQYYSQLVDELDQLTP